jgi:hypothetical protein
MELFSQHKASSNLSIVEEYTLYLGDAINGDYTLHVLSAFQHEISIKRRKFSQFTV